MIGLLAIPAVSAPSAGAEATHPLRTAAQEAGAGAVAAGCARPARRGSERCFLSVEPVPPVAAPGRRPDTSTCTVNESAGYTPCNLQGAYGLTAASAADGKGRTVAVVDAMDDPNAQADLAVYRSTYGLPACTTASGCFRKVNQNGVAGNYPAPDGGWSQEISLDLDMVSAICPNCHILLVEANSSGLGDLGAAEAEAAALKARFITSSWGSGEFNGETGYDGDFNHPGVAETFSSGDGAYQAGVQYPSASPYVASVGGTELTPAANTRGWTETTWVTPGNPPTQGSGSGCSSYEPKPLWQTDSGCSNRTTADVSAVAANVLSYDTYDLPSGASGWWYNFGTSVSTPIVASVYALASKLTDANPASVPYVASASYLFDITKGATGTCTPSYLCSAGTGYDGPTGRGTPRGPKAFAGAGAPSPMVSSVTFSGSSANPTITIAGANLGSGPPPGTPESCQAGDTGDDFGVSLWFDDVTQGWAAGEQGDCIGMTVSSWSSTQVQLTFGNEYANYPAVQTGDQVRVQVGTVNFQGSLAAAA